MIQYHRTTAANAKEILRGGFCDGVAIFGLSQESGVWLSDTPLDSDEGAWGDTVLRIELPGHVVADYEKIEDGKPQREWLVPAVNQ
jgi:hypothetical protein